MDNSFIELLATKQNMDISEVSIYIETFVFGFATELQQNQIVHFDPYGAFEVEKELEYIEEDDKGCKTLMPPCLKASFSSSAIFGVLKTEEEEVANAIYQVFYEQHDWEKEAVSLFIAQIKSVIKSLLLKNKSCAIPKFGTFEGELGGDISFSFDEHFENLINKPFAHFIPVQLTCTEKELTNYTEKELNSENIKLDKKADFNSVVSEDAISKTEESEPYTTKSELNNQKEKILKETSDVNVEVEERMAHYNNRISEIEKKISSQDQVITLYKRLTLILGVILLLILGVWYWTYQNNQAEKAEVEVIYQEEISSDNPQKTFAELEDEMYQKWQDSIAQTANDTVELLHTQLDTLNTKDSTVRVSEIVMSDTTQQVPTEKRSHTLKSGETLRSLAYKYYKNKDRWADIYKSNLNIINNPDNIPIGTVLLIPSL